MRTQACIAHSKITRQAPSVLGVVISDEMRDDVRGLRSALENHLEFPFLASKVYVTAVALALYSPSSLLIALAV